MIHRVLIIVGSQGWGGAERQALLLGIEFRRAGIDVRFAACGARGTFFSRAGHEGFTVVSTLRPESSLAVISLLKSALAAATLWSIFRPDIVIGFTSPANAIAGWMGRLFRVPAIWGQRDAGIQRLHRLVENGAVAGCRLAIANGPAADEHARHLGFPDSHRRRFSNIVSVDTPILTRTQWRKKLNIPVESHVTVMCATLSAAKDHTLLLHAWKISQGHSRSSWLVLAGNDGGTGQLIRNLISDMSVQVIVLGEIEDMAGLLTAVDLAVLSSHGEGQPNAVLEAIALGLPTIATDLPATRELLPAHALWPPGDTAKAAKILSASISGSIRPLGQLPTDSLPSTAQRSWLDAIEAAQQTSSRV